MVNLARQERWARRLAHRLVIDRYQCCRYFAERQANQWNDCEGSELLSARHPI